MPVIKTQDRVDEFRIIIEGRLAAESVKEVASLWANALAQSLPRRMRVDISLLTGYDAAGRKLLRELHLHGTDFAASTPASLVFLGEITAPRRRGITIIHESVPEPVNVPADSAPRPIRVRAATGG